ncbi:Uncharacterized protein Fot_27353 [Forsythia ovata]|uniref:Uncharacterized protein n=1 Tax=Forsythia ovata TaxID=205694 RepID=A0ABD1UFT5_9LAMI
MEGKTGSQRLSVERERGTIVPILGYWGQRKWEIGVAHECDTVVHWRITSLKLKRICCEEREARQVVEGKRTLDLEPNKIKASPNSNSNSRLAIGSSTKGKLQLKNAA